MPGSTETPAPDDPKGLLPVLALRGSPRVRGRTHGGELRSQVQDNWTRWLDARAAAGSSRPQAELFDLVDTTGFERAMSRWTPAILEEIHGIAEGAGVDRRVAVALNLLDEGDWLLPTTIAPGGKCSSVALRPRADRVCAVGETMDLPARFDGTQVLLHLHGEHEALILAFAGIVGLCGYNRDGLAVCCNQMSGLTTSTDGLPVAAMARRALTARSALHAAAQVRSTRHASGQHYLLADAHDVLSLECSAQGVTESSPGTASVAHTNHPLSNNDRRLLDSSQSEGFSGRSAPRLEFLEQTLPDVTSAQGLREALSDRSVPISKDVADGDGSFTFGAFVVEPGDPDSGWWSPGPPHTTGWQHLPFDR